MSIRPYPAAARAWRHVMRRYRYERPPHLPAAPPPSMVGEYRLSTRAQTPQASRS
ncbi:hypothetical protein [Streptomyces sp. NPDC045251]|uniref:hypothetical protein n=1 Tax=unclassified Streptomyces TaxID=2593676 RepID=UPI0033C83757